MKKTIIIASVILAGLALFCGCQTVPKEIPEDLDARQLIQRGQDNYDEHRYKAAEKYFNTVLERFGDDPKHYLEAKYELGHLYLKKKKYSAAYDTFMEIEEIYKNVPVGLPGAYKILCGIELAKIPADKVKEFEERKKAPVQEPQPAQEAAPAAETPAEQAAVEQTPAEQAPAAEEAAAPNEQDVAEKKEPSSEEGPNQTPESANE